MRVALARVLLGRPDVLLMDEPTNHLDLESIIWLEQFLKNYPGALLMTSHDREFMNRIITKVVEIDSGSLTTYSGNYEFYEQQRALNEKQQQAQFERQQAMLAKEIKFIERFKARASHVAEKAEFRRAEGVRRRGVVLGDVACRVDLIVESDEHALADCLLAACEAHGVEEVDRDRKSVV